MCNETVLLSCDAFQVNGETYKSGTAAELLGYLVGGGSRDW